VSYPDFGPEFFFPITHSLFKSFHAAESPSPQQLGFSHLQGSKESKSILNIPNFLKADRDDLIFVYGKGHLHDISSICGEILWRKDLASIEVNYIVQSLEVIFFVAAFVGSSTFYMYELNVKNGELLIA
jgi:hypothetical protein